MGHLHPILVQQFAPVAIEILRLSQPCERRAKDAEADQRVRGILPEGNDWGCARPGCAEFKNKGPKDVYTHLEQVCVPLPSLARQTLSHPLPCRHSVRDPRRRDIRYTSRSEWIVPFPSIQLNVS
jgi:hypothetical protein